MAISTPVTGELRLALDEIVVRENVRELDDAHSYLGTSNQVAGRSPPTGCGSRSTSTERRRRRR